MHSQQDKERFNAANCNQAQILSQMAIALHRIAALALHCIALQWSTIPMHYNTLQYNTVP
eukprot:250153-Lingulodinium_polyedra.AAC.1